MDAYAFALTLGTAGLAAMTVLGFHHGHAPGGSGHGHHSTLADALARARLITVSGGGGGTGAAEAATQSMMNVIQTVLAAQLVAKGDLAGLGEIVVPTRPDGAEAPPSPAKSPTRPGRAAGE